MTKIPTEEEVQYKHTHTPKKVNSLWHATLAKPSLAAAAAAAASTTTTTRTDANIPR